MSADSTYRPHSDFRAEVSSDHQSYLYRVRVPFTYGDQVTRITVFTYASWDYWLFDINSRGAGPNGQRFPTREKAVEGALNAIRETAAVLLKVRKKDLMPDVPALDAAGFID